MNKRILIYAVVAISLLAPAMTLADDWLASPIREWAFPPIMKQYEQVKALQMSGDHSEAMARIASLVGKPITLGDTKSVLAFSRNDYYAWYKPSNIGHSYCNSIALLSKVCNNCRAYAKSRRAAGDAKSALQADALAAMVARQIVHIKPEFLMSVQGNSLWRDSWLAIAEDCRALGDAKGAGVADSCVQRSKAFVEKIRTAWKAMDHTGAPKSDAELTPYIKVENEACAKLVTSWDKSVPTREANALLAAASGSK